MRRLADDEERTAAFPLLLDERTGGSGSSVSKEFKIFRLLLVREVTATATYQTMDQDGATDALVEVTQEKRRGPVEYLTHPQRHPEEKKYLHFQAQTGCEKSWSTLDLGPLFSHLQDAQAAFSKGCVWKCNPARENNTAARKSNPGVDIYFLC